MVILAYKFHGVFRDLRATSFYENPDEEYIFFVEVIRRMSENMWSPIFCQLYSQGSKEPLVETSFIQE